MNERISLYMRATHRIWIVLLVLVTACTVVEMPAPGAASRTPAPAEVALPSPTPVLPSDQLLARALRAHALGDYDASATDLSALLAAYPDAAEARPARYYLAESYAERGRWTSAVETLRIVVADSTQDTLRARAQFWLARGYEAAGEWAQAVAAYQAYRELQTPLEPYAAMRQAAQQQALGQLEQAAQTYEYAANADIDRGERAGSYEKAIALRQQLGQKDAALALYKQLLSLARDPSYRARILLEAATLAKELGQADTVHAWLREIIDKTPDTAQAADAATSLLADATYQASPQALGQAAAARILFGVERYADAVPLFDAAIAAASGDDALELRRLRALALRGQAQQAQQGFDSVLDELAAIGATSPDSDPGRQAQLDWIQTLGWSGQTDRAIDAYRQYATTYGGSSEAAADPRAPQALARVAELLDTKEDADNATQQRLDLAQRYPQSEQAPTALYAAGWHLYRSGNSAAAQSAWQTVVANQAVSAAARAQSAFWAGVAASAQGTRDQANTLWQGAQLAQPNGYYGTRAADKLIEAGVPVSATLATHPVDMPLGKDDWIALEQWVTGAFGQPVPHDATGGYPQDVAGAGHIVRGQALAEVGLRTESMAEWMDARDDWFDDPPKLLLLARMAHEHALPYIALQAASRLASLAPANAPAAPDALRRLLYPTPYSALVVADAREQGVDPLLLYALLRQESLFNPGAVSSAGAYGLAQVMPETGRGIAQRLDISGYDPNMLLHPATGVRFGAFYIAQQIESMDDNIFAGLAAYNGGPGNARRWIEATSLSDPDVYVESIDYGETRTYVKQVYAQYDVYRRLYAAP